VAFSELALQEGLLWMCDDQEEMEVYHALWHLLSAIKLLLVILSLRSERISQAKILYFMGSLLRSSNTTEAGSESFILPFIFVKKI
jgi:hypothetical protein